MAHRRKKAEPSADCVGSCIHTAECASDVPLETERDDATRVNQRGDERVGEAEAMSEVVYSVLPSLHATDSTEQLLVYMLVRLLATLEDTDWRTLFAQVWRRVLVSFVTHHFMIYLSHACPALDAPFRM